MAEHRDPAPQLDAGSRLWTLTAAGACLLALLWQLPAALAIAIAVLGLAVAGLSWRRPMPAWLRLLLALSIIAAVAAAMDLRFGRDTGCALLAAMLALKPAETASRRDARSLLGFALFAPFAAFLLDQGPLTLLLATFGVIAALLVLARLADGEAGLVQAPVSWRERLWGIGRLVLIGLPLLLAAFWLFPRFPVPLWGVPERALAQPGLSDRMSPGGWLDLMADDSPALRVQFFGATPPREQMYWRGLVLWDYDGSEWTRAPWTAQLPALPVARADVRWDYEMAIEPTEQRWLVALDLPLAAPAGARVDRDQTLTTQRALSSISRWRLRSAPPTGFDASLEYMLRQRALALPPALNPRTRALARQWRSDAGADDLAIVQRALEWIRDDFAYTLDTPLPGRDAVDEFLFDQQRGYCEHFSSAFTVLMRAAGIPARVVVGYAGGYHNAFGDYWVVRRMDAHAWTEVWLPQRGWVRVDPTAAVAPERVFDTLEDRLAGGGAGGLLGGHALFDAGDWLRRGWNDFVLGFDARRQAHLLQGLGVDRIDPAGLGTTFALLAALVLAGMAWLLARGERERDPLLRAWHRLVARYARLGLAAEPHEPALTWALRVAAARPGAAATLVPLSQRFAAARYAAAVSDIPALVRDLRRHRP